MKPDLQATTVVDQRPPKAVSIKGVSVTLGGNRILKNVTLDFEAEATSALIGPNGAGKSTLLNYICRIIPSISGSLEIWERNADPLRPHEVLGVGLARTFQGSQFVGELSAVENVMLGFHIHTDTNLFRNLFRTPAARRTEAAARSAALNALDRVGVANLANLRTGDLSFGNQKKIDLARALVAGAPCILLDEPMAGLSAEEKDGMSRVLIDLRSAGGLTIVLVEHDMRVVGNLCASTAVLDAGELIAQGPTKEVLGSPRVIEAYMGSGHSQAAGLEVSS